jgi:hypothetical protein
MMRSAGIAVAVAGCSLALAPAAHAVDFTVNETGDASDASVADAPNACDVDVVAAGPQCTLRAAIEESNATPGDDAILFSIPGGGVQTIDLTAELPELTGLVSIDGYTQPGATENSQPVGKPLDAVLRVELDGTDVPKDAEITNGLTVAPGGAGSTIRGLVLNNWAPWSGIEIHSANSITVAGNYIGTNAAGSVAEPNGTGIFGFGGTNTQIGGSAPEDRNLISGNTRDGIGTNIPMNTQGNYIGVAADGKSDLGNERVGVSWYSSFAAGIGGADGAANVIAFNGEDGVDMVNASAGIPITNNRIFSNGGIGIDLNQDGPTPNDPGDADGGSNETQNYPVLESATTKAGRTKVKGRLNSVPGLEYRLEFFFNKARERQGRKPIGTLAVITGGGGNVAFRFKPPKKVKAGRFITATATNENDSTSEFSKARKVKRR